MPHFIILGADGKIEDYSVDKEASPSITSYSDFPVSGEGSCGVFLSSIMRLIMRQKEEKELRTWHFDDQPPILSPTETNDPVEARIDGLCASSSTGKLFIYGGYNDSITETISN